MIGVVATLRAKEGREAEFETAFAEMTAGVRAHEPGNSLYQLTKSRTEPRTYKVLEIYADAAAVEAHRASDHYRAGGRKLADLLEGRPDIEVLDTVG